MSRLSNSLIGIINALTLLLSIPIVIIAVSSYFHGGKTECFKSIQLPFLIFALFLFIISLLGLIGSCCRVSSFLGIYLVFMFLLILALICFTIFIFVVTTIKAGGEAIINQQFSSGGQNNDLPYKLFKDYYSPWLMRRVVNGRSWDQLKTCMVEAKICNAAAVENDWRTGSEAWIPIQSGCCMPPRSCGFTHINATFWEVPKKSSAVNYLNEDCTEWNHKEDLLCYNCGTCKGGVLHSLTMNGKSLSKFNVSILLFLIIVYTISCCAFKTDRSNRYNGYSGYNYPA